MNCHNLISFDTMDLNWYLILFWNVFVLNLVCWGVCVSNDEQKLKILIVTDNRIWRTKQKLSHTKVKSKSYRKCALRFLLLIFLSTITDSTYVAITTLTSSYIHTHYFLFFLLFSRIFVLDENLGAYECKTCFRYVRV